MRHRLISVKGRIDRKMFLFHFAQIALRCIKRFGHIHRACAHVPVQHVFQRGDAGQFMLFRAAARAREAPSHGLAVLVGDQRVQTGKIRLRRAASQGGKEGIGRAFRVQRAAGEGEQQGGVRRESLLDFEHETS